MTFDLIVIGGGIAGSSLARRVAATGARVLVLERETTFHDRIRGEAMQPWGVGEAQALGILDLLRPCSQEMRYFDQIINGQLMMHRDLLATTPQGLGMLGFYHPEAQEILLQAAEDAGADVRRGVSARRVGPGPLPRVFVDQANGPSFVAEARLVAICAGRNPGLRADLGFEVLHGSIPVFLSGVWLTHLSDYVDHSIAYVANNVTTGSVCGFFPQPGDRARAYFGFHPEYCPRLQGDYAFARFKSEFEKNSGGAIPFGDARPDGPLASFECADVWVDHPYNDGVALVGDAAASNDPSWGQGLSLSLRDARVLADQLAADSDWHLAGHRYAESHDEHYRAVRTVSGWFHDMFQRLGPAADERRARALPLIGQDPTRVPDVLFSGPDFPLHAGSRARFFGEDTIAAQAS